MDNERVKILDRMKRSGYWNIHDLIGDYLELANIEKAEEIKGYERALKCMYKVIESTIKEDFEEV